MNKARLCEKLDLVVDDFLFDENQDWYAFDVIGDIIEIAKEHMSNKGLKLLIKKFEKK